MILTKTSSQNGCWLQRHGLGEGRKLGCGVFIPHKDVGDLRGARPDWED